jgi:glycosyltransferase involved in cell wall biosynthesis
VIGGSVKYADLLDQGLRSIGHQTIVFSRQSILAGMVNRSLISNKKMFGGFGGLLIQITTSWLSLKAPIVWIVHHPVMGCLALLARRNRLIYICHGPWAEEARDMGSKNIRNRFLEYIRGCLQTLLLERANTVLFLSSYMQNRIVISLGIKKKDGQVIGLITPIVDISSRESEELDDEKIVRIRGRVYICRRLVERTGVADFVKKYAHSAYCDKFTIIIAGDGPDKANIEALVSEYKLKNIYLAGFVGDYVHKRNFQASEFMVLPSLANEGFGLVIIEAISHDCIPVVSVKAGGGADWLGGICPDLVYDGSIDGLVSCIEYARTCRSFILTSLKNRIKELTKEEAAIIIEASCRTQTKLDQHNM